MSLESTNERPSLDQDRAFADTLASVAGALVILTKAAVEGGEYAVALPARPSREHPGALSLPFLADLLAHAAAYVEEHTP